MRIARSAVMFVGAPLSFVPFAIAQMKTFKAQLSGKNEVPAVSSSGTGEATFQLSGDGKSLMYTLSVSDIEDVTMAHVHLGGPGTVGEHVAPLYPTKVTPAMGQKKEEMGTAKQRMKGVTVLGEIRSNDLVGSLKGKTIADLVAEFRAGKAYVNVHSKAHPDGEIRGPIE